MNSNEAEKNKINLKEFDELNEDCKNNLEKRQNVNNCLPKFLTDDYFKDNSSNSIDEESNEENSFDNKNDNSTQDNSNKFINYNNLYPNNNSNINNIQYHSFQNYYCNNNNNNLISNLNNNSVNNLNINYFGDNNLYIYNNSNSFNNLISQNWNSFSGQKPINSFNLSNNNMLHLSFNNNKNIKCLSFNKSKIYRNNFLVEKNVNDYNNNNSQNLNMPIKKLLEMSEQNLYNYIITQKGSRDAQNIIKKVKENEVELLISKIKNYFSDITIDKYGNYFSTKLIQICLPSQRMQLLESMNNRFVEIANNSFGTIPLQSLIETTNMPEEKQIVLNYILNNEIALALDSRGSHVLQKFISGTKDEERNDLNKNLINLIDKLIFNCFGVCVLIKLIKHTKDKNIIKIIANYITNHEPLSFIQHPYSNYAVQSLISNTDLSYCDEIIDTVIKNYLSLSMQKYSSNVVEKCIEYGKENTIKKIFKNIVENENIENLLNNNYGNFVLEKLIAKLNKEEKNIFIKKIEKLGKTKNISKNIKKLLYK